MERLLWSLSVPEDDRLASSAFVKPLPTCNESLNGSTISHNHPNPPSNHQNTFRSSRLKLYYYSLSSPHHCSTVLMTVALLLCFLVTLGQCYEQYAPYKGLRNYGSGYGTYTDAYQHHHHQSHQQQQSHQQYNQYGISLVGNDYPPAAPHYPTAYAPYRKYYKQYLPGPQYCPETGRTVCSKVAPFYPTDEVFAVVKMARAKRFNISSEFVDESENDAEPHFDDHDEPWPEPEPFLSQMPHVDFGGSHQHGGNGHTKPIAHFHNFDYKPYFIAGPTKPEYRATVPPPYQQKLPIYSSTSYSSPPGISYSAPMPIVHPQHGRYKRQAAADLPIEPVCPSRVILIEPKAALNDKRQWKFVVNLSERDSRLKQAIKVEVCTTPNQPCSQQINLPFGFISRCRQKYIKKKLISLDPTGQSISSENFFAPSCCVCEVIRPTVGADQTAAASNQIDSTSSTSGSSTTTTKKRRKK